MSGHGFLAPLNCAVTMIDQEQRLIFSRLEVNLLRFGQMLIHIQTGEQLLQCDPLLLAKD